MLPSTGPLRAASDAERQRLHDHFRALCAIASPSREERAAVDHAAAILRAAGLVVAEDDAPSRIGGDAGNLLCRIPGTDSAAAETVLLCAHLDTVPVGRAPRPVVRDGAWQDADGGLLGADDKATVAALLVVAERLAVAPAPVAVELLLTVQEETQLRGAGAVAREALAATVGYVIDHPTPLGGIVTAAPGHVRFEAIYRGRAAHAGIAPEAGRSAILAVGRALVALPHGRLASGATVNVGHVDGGVAGPGPGEPATNVVPAHGRIVGEVRGLDERTLQATVDAVEAVLHDAAHDPAGPVDLDLSFESRFSPYAHRPASPPYRHAVAALTALGIEPRPFADAGGSDANVLNRLGIPTVNLAGGNERAHEPGERIAVSDLETTLELLLALLREHAAVVR